MMSFSCVNKEQEKERIRMESISYKESNIDERIIRAVEEMGFETMTPIQQQAIPCFLEGKDIIGQAQTGTGKTAAFGIPVLMSVDPKVRSLQALVLCPTRELAIQAAEEMRKFAKYMHGVKILPIYGGQDIGRQIRALKNEVQIVVGTPGRVMDHMRRHTLKLEQLKMIVLDEADEMLNMGFREDIETILKETPKERQTALFSATMPKAILDITHAYQKPDAVHVKVAQKEVTVPLISQYYYQLQSKQKEEVLSRLLDYYNPKRTLIFCNTKRMVDQLAESLKARGYNAEGLHGDLSQNQRDTVMNLFRGGRADILIATDVAARGIDVDDVEAVFNFDVPEDIEYYVHRIGRTGRAGRTGRSFTFVVGREIYKLREIERTCKTKIKERNVPSAAEITAVKADKILNEALEVAENQNLDKMTAIIDEKLETAGITATELAAAFLKLGMGEELKDIKLEKFVPRRYGEGRNGRDKGFDRQNGRHGRSGRAYPGEKKEYGSYAEGKKRRFDRKEVQNKNYQSRKAAGLKRSGRKEKKGEAV